ncbi:MAG: winged helix-turn-helix transcriptional regulator [Chamaesiphon sp.]|nr:winged helix-turn-helix transcriptional regulator [Chamaesiphon sp.]
MTVRQHIYSLQPFHTTHRQAKDGALRFGELRRKIGGISTKVLTERLRMLASMEIVNRHYAPTIPPQVTYSLTERGNELTKALIPLYKLAHRWQKLIALK